MILEVKNYTKFIKKKKVLDNINLKLKSGSVYGFYGRNGSGKTMLFRAISTLIFPTVGDILIDGKSIIKDDFDLSKIGLLLDEPGFYDHLSGLENLCMLYEINNKRDIDFIKKMMEQIGLESDINKRYKEYSLGMKQKLRFIQAIIEDQKLIILDEPTNGLDELSVKKMHDIILKLKRENKIVLIASHNKEDLNLLCNKIFKIEDGRIIGDVKL